ncbi:MAG TPA: glycosyltransferase family 1 protein [Patescibacteria group bacterium]
MIIGIDGNEANVEKRVGISEYAYELLVEFSKQKASHIQFYIYLKSNPLPHMPKETGNWKYIVFGPQKLWTQFALPLKLFTQKKKPNVFFSPTHYAPRFSPVPTAIAIMDVSYMRFPELFAQKDLYQLQNWTSYSAKQASKIFTISTSSKNDIIKYYPVKSENVVVTYPGIKLEIENMKDIPSIDYLQKTYLIPKKYILFVGTIQPRKNIARLIEAYAQIANKNKDVDLVIVGKKGWLYEPILETPEKLGIAQRVHILNFVSDSDLAGFYANALCFVLPSLYEGFGLPVLEAMKYGCPVITSNVSSLPEAGGDACLYVDPNNTNDIALKMEKLITDSTLRKSLITKGKEHIKKFSWENSAKKTLEVLESIAK